MPKKGGFILLSLWKNKFTFALKQVNNKKTKG